jgi:NAD(P)-dependent dehydrogenase (short-subunit alcohol dehydrogenase family)
MDLDLKGKTALVTGGGRGIGRGIALALAAEGVDVAIASRNPEPETVDELKMLSVKAHAIPTDVSKEEQVTAMVARAIELLGHLDIYVNNAGHHWHEPLTRITTQNWLNTINTNTSACVWAVREVSRHMIARGSGSILIVCSTIQFNPGYKETSYRASKASLKACAETWALELAPFGIRVNVLSPGIFPTKLAANLKTALADEEFRERFIAEIPMRRLGDPEECGPAAAFLLSDKASPYTTGADLVIDGGFKLRPLTLIKQDEILRMNRPT